MKMKEISYFDKDAPIEIQSDKMILLKCIVTKYAHDVTLLIMRS